MRAIPQDIDAEQLAAALRRHWDVTVERLDYWPEGGGAYHWVGDGGGASPWFVTCDDLDTKPWLGTDRDSTFAGLLRAYGTAGRLRRD
ncbi:MAG TPA: hypothetical protein VGP46_06460, partial [Acidimicrobiales bacterium]|nr:hypothetical protein [Acidimicrobiales bacterium]